MSVRIVIDAQPLPCDTALWMSVYTPSCTRHILKFCVYACMSGCVDMHVNLYPCVHILIFVSFLSIYLAYYSCTESSVCSELTALCTFVPSFQIAISLPVLIKLHADIFCHGKVSQPYTLYFHTIMRLPLHLCYVMFISSAQFLCTSLFGGLLNLIRIPVNVQKDVCGIAEMSSLVCWQKNDKCVCLLVCVRAKKMYSDFWFWQQVAELSSRSALLQWLPPERLTEAATSEGKSPEFEFSEADLRYEVLLSDKGKEGKYKSIYSGISLSCRYETAWLLVVYAAYSRIQSGW